MHRIRSVGIVTAIVCIGSWAVTAAPIDPETRSKMNAQGMIPKGEPGQPMPQVVELADPARISSHQPGTKVATEANRKPLPAVFSAIQANRIDLKKAAMQPVIESKGGAERGGVGTDCCVVHPTPGCEDQAIEDCVCALDSFCCVVEWDQFCVNEVDGFGCGTCFAPITNDNCADAIALNADGEYPFSTGGATTDGPALPASCDEGFGLGFGQDIWYCLTPTCTATVTVSLCGSGYDTRMAVYNDCACPANNARLVACNDDSCGGTLQSEVSFAATAGNSYLIRVGGFGTSAGSGTMTISGAGGSNAGDCNANGTPDGCEATPTTDCDGDGTLDECQTTVDCDGNGTFDACELGDNDCNGNGVPDQCDLTGGTQVFQYTIPVSPSRPISNTLPPATHTFNVGQAGTLTDVDVGVTLTHTWVGDLEIEYSHLGTTVRVYDNNCGNVDNMQGTMWDDEAAGNISCVLNNVGTFRPVNPLSAFDGLEMAGDWTITVRDTVGGDSGALTGWFLRLSVPGTNDCDGNGVPDECDPDCNDNGIPDGCDIIGGTSEDCQPDGTPDECQLGRGSRGEEQLFFQPVDPTDNGVGPGLLIAIGSSCPFNNTSAEDFTLTDNASITRITWEGVYFGAAPDFPGVDNNFAVTFYEDNGSGNVGPVVAHFATVDVVKALSSRPAVFGSNPVYAYSADLDPAVAVTGGQRYWVSINGDPAGSGGPVFGWMVSQVGNASSVPGNDQPLQNVSTPCSALPATSYTPGGTAGDQDADVALGLYGGAGGGDCNENGIPDDCDIAGGTSADCDLNGKPDECEFVDCNNNGTFDDCDILADPSSDQGGGEGAADCDEPDGILDSCQDCNNNGTVDCADLLPGTSNIKDEFANPNLAIPDCAGADVGASSSINFTQCGPIEDLNVQLQINHTWVGDLYVTLEHDTTGTLVTLMSRVGFAETDPNCTGGECCGNSSDNVNVTFDDSAGASIETATTLTGTFRPDAGASGNPSALSTFNGEDKCGSWTVTAYDGAGADVGTLISWGLIFTNGAIDPPYSEDCNGTGIPDECELSGGLQTYEHTIPVSPTRPISNTLPPATHTFSAAETGPVADVDVGVTLTHTWSSDLEIRLIHGATSVAVFDNQCGSEDNFNGTVWDDEAAGNINCVAGHAGTFRPFQPLSAFDGAEASGDWTISVTDNVGGDSGALSGWFLRIQAPGTNDCDNNGTPDECDPDCNENGAPDACDIASGVSEDCDFNGTPDECQPDCNGNGIADGCDIANGTSDDCNKDGTPDECAGTPGGPKSYEVTANLPIEDLGTVSHTFEVSDSGVITDLDVRIDLNHTWIGDLIITVSHNGADVDLWRNQCGNTDNMLVIFDDEGLDDALCTDIPNGELRLKTAGELFDGGPGLSVFDGMDKAGDWTVTIQDTAGADVGTLNTYRLDFVNEGTGGVGLIDCNTNGLLDECDITFGLSTDCNLNGTPDECEPGEADCNNNGTNDLCDISSGQSQDLNLDEVPDECQDCNNNGTPDFFDVLPTNIKFYGKNFNPPAAIPDGNCNGVSSTINVGEFGFPADVDVALVIDHDNNGDLYITLSHGGVTVTLLSRPGLNETNPCTGGGGSNNDGMDIKLSDQAIFSIETADSGGGVLLGTYRPHAGASGNGGLLSAFNAVNKFGPWTLTVRDAAGGNTGTLISWQLRIGNNEPFSDDCNQNGTPDECESDDDCNNNGILDECELGDNDCNEDGIPDDCQLGDNDCNNNGTPDDCEIGGGSATVSYDIPVSPPAAIPDANPAGASHTFNVPSGGAIQDVNVDINITHTWIGDLEIRVTHGGTSVLLFDNQCGNVDNFSGTIFDDEAAGTISCAAGNAGTFRPFQALSAFDGMNAAGDWTISAVDSVGADVGTINAWSLHFTVAAAGNDCNGNGVPDECDEDCNANGTPDDCEFQDTVTNYAIPVSPPRPINSTLPPATHTFNVAASGPVQDVNVDVSLTHTWSSDLEIRVSHEATTVLLFDNQCGSEDNFNGTIFDDEAAGPIACTAGHAGTFRPLQALSAFDGMEASGDWTMSVTDNVGGDSGALTAWSLRIVTPPQGDCNGNGIPDECELDNNDCNNNGTPDECDEDCNDNGTPDDCEDITPPTEKFYDQTPNVAIPNNTPAGVSTTINVPDHGLVGDVNVWLYIDHQEQGDLRVTLSHNNVPVLLINRAGSNASGCGPSVYGYAADDFGSAGTPLILDDGAGVGIDCYNGPAPANTGIFSYAGPASPSQSLTTYNSMDKFGDWTLTVSDHLFYNSGTVVYWALEILNQGVGDCNENGIPDECDIASGASTDANNNGIPDECEFVRVAQVVSAVSRKACELGLMPRATEPRIGGVDFVDVEFDTEIDGCDMALEWAPCSGGDYAPYTGSSTVSCFTVGEHLYVNFSPGLESHQRYRISFGEGTTVVPDQSVEFRTLLGDVNQDGVVNATDRSMVVGIWTGSGFSCQTDINDDSLTNAVDRSSVVGVWTGGANVCPWE